MSTKRRVAMAVAVFAAAACGKTLQEICEDSIRRGCERKVTCQADAGGIRFDNVPSCVNFVKLVASMGDAGYKCDTLTETNACPAGQKLDRAKFEQCSDAVAASTCEEFNAPDGGVYGKPPCSELCK